MNFFTKTATATAAVLATAGSVAVALPTEIGGAGVGAGLAIGAELNANNLQLTSAAKFVGSGSTVGGVKKKAATGAGLAIGTELNANDLHMTSAGLQGKNLFIGIHGKNCATDDSDNGLLKQDVSFYGGSNSIYDVSGDLGYMNTIVNSKISNHVYAGLSNGIVWKCATDNANSCSNLATFNDKEDNSVLALALSQKEDFIFVGLRGGKVKRCSTTTTNSCILLGNLEPIADSDVHHIRMWLSLENDDGVLYIGNSQFVNKDVLNPKHYNSNNGVYQILDPLNAIAINTGGAGFALGNMQKLQFLSSDINDNQVPGSQLRAMSKNEATGSINIGIHDYYNDYWNHDNFCNNCFDVASLVILTPVRKDSNLMDYKVINTGFPLNFEIAQMTDTLEGRYIFVVTNSHNTDKARLYRCDIEVDGNTHACESWSDNIQASIDNNKEKYYPQANVAVDGDNIFYSAGNMLIQCSTQYKGSCRIINSYSCGLTAMALH